MSDFFGLKEHGTTLKTELIAGLTTFLTMAYTLAVNVAILSQTGLQPTAVFLATAIAAAAGTIFMGLYANIPLALAPGLGLNAFFTFTIVLTYGYKVDQALAMVFLSGVAFLIISLLGLRKRIIDTIPTSLKQSIGAGIGFFIAFIGLYKMGVIVKDDATLVRLGSLHNPTVLLGIFGLIVMVILFSKNINGAVFIGIVITALVGMILNSLGVTGMPSFPKHFISFTFNTSSFGLFFHGLKTLHYNLETFIVVFTLLFVDFFDTAGTLIAITNKIGEHSGYDYDPDRMFYSDAIGTIVGAIFGTSNVASYIESTSGVIAGGRTGLTSVVVGILFIFSMIFSPLLSVVSGIKVGDAILLPTVAPALVIVGVLMATQLSNVDWHNFEEAAAGFITVIMMILTYSIANGVAAGFIIYVCIKLAKGKAKDIPIALWVLFILFILHFTNN